MSLFPNKKIVWVEYLEALDDNSGEYDYTATGNTFITKGSFQEKPGSTRDTNEVAQGKRKTVQYLWTTSANLPYLEDDTLVLRVDNPCNITGTFEIRNKTKAQNGIINHYTYTCIKIINSDKEIV